MLSQHWHVSFPLSWPMAYMASQVHANRSLMHTSLSLYCDQSVAINQTLQQSAAQSFDFSVSFLPSSAIGRHSDIWPACGGKGTMTTHQDVFLSLFALTAWLPTNTCMCDSTNRNPPQPLYCVYLFSMRFSPVNMYRNTNV